MIICLVSGIYSITIYYLKVNTNINVIRYDLLTVTAGDYTIELELSKSQIQNFKTEFGDRIKASKGGIGLCLKKYLMEKMSFKIETAQTRRYARMGELDEELNLEIADIQFVVNNRQLIDLLQ